MALSDWAKPRPTAAQGFLPTQPGDPNYQSAAGGSQSQFPAAAAESRLAETQTRGQNRLGDAFAAGYDTSQPQFDPLQQAAEQGFTERALTLGENLLGWVDGPRQAINLMIQDIAGGVAEEGERDPGFGDYMDALFSGVNDEEGFQLATGLNPRSGSMTLDMFGWAEEDSIGGRIGRGIVDFGFQVLTDPLTYITFGLSGLGKKAAMGAARTMQTGSIKNVLEQLVKGNVDDGVLKAAGLTDYERHLVANIETIKGDFLTDFKGKMMPNGKMDPEFEEAISKYLGRSGEEDVMKHWTELALAQRINKDVMQPLISRDFKNINALAKQDLPMWARGGARISVPFFQSTLTRGYELGGVGVGRKFVGDPLRTLSTNLAEYSPAYKKMASSISSGLNHMDRMRPILKGLESGDLAGWQYHIAADAIENISNSANREIMTAMFNSKFQKIKELADVHGLDMNDINTTLMNRLERADIEQVAYNQYRKMFGPGGPGEGLAEGDFTTLYPELDATLNETAAFMRASYEEYHNALAVLDDKVKKRFIDGYTPHKTSDAGRSVLHELAVKGAAPPSSPMVDSLDPGEQLFVRLLSAQSVGGRLETNLGAMRYGDEASQGRQHALTLSDDGAMLIDEEFTGFLRAMLPDVMGPDGELLTEGTARALPATKLNELLEPVIRRQADLHGVTLPKAWDGKVFSEDPFEVSVDFLGNLDEAVHIWKSMDALRTAGLAMRKSTAIDAQDTLQAMLGNVARRTQKVKVPHFGKPLQGQKTAPVDFIKKLRDPIEDTPREETVAYFVQLGKIPEDMPVEVNITESGVAYLADGHNRLVAAERLGLEEIPVVYHDVPDSVAPWVDEVGMENVDLGAAEEIDVRIRQQLGLPPGEELPPVQTAPTGQFGMDVKDHLLPYKRDHADMMADADFKFPSPAEAATREPLDEEVLGQAMNNWAGSGKDTRRIISDVVEGKVTKHGDSDQAEALTLVRAFQERAKPLQEWSDEVNYTEEIGKGHATPINPGDKLSRVSRDRPGKYEPDPNDPLSGQPLPEGSVFDVNFEATGYGTHPFKEKRRKNMEQYAEAGEEDKQSLVSWVYEFSEDTPTMPNTSNRFEQEMFVSGKFRVESVDEATRTVQLSYQGEVLPIMPTARRQPASIIPSKPVAKTADAMFSTTPWGATYTEKRVLRGAESGAKKHVPAYVLNSVKTWGATGNDLAEVKRVIELSQMPKDEFFNLSPRHGTPKFKEVTFEKLPAKADDMTPTHAAQISYDEDGFRIALNPEVKPVDRWPHTVRQLDEFLVDNGKLEMESLNQLALDAADETTSEQLYRYLNWKTAQLGKAAEWLTQQPEEVLLTKSYFDDFVDEINSLARSVAAVQQQDGTLVTDKALINILGDSEMAASLARLHKIAESAKADNYDELAKIMRDATDMTSVATEDMVNPGLYALAGPALEDLAVQKDVAIFLRNSARNSALMYTPQGIAAAKTATNNFLRWWRGMATIARPSFHIRNVVGGAWMNMIHGVSNTDYAMVALNAPRVRAALRKGTRIEDVWDTLGPEAGPVLKAAWESNVMSGFSSTEFRRLTTPEKAGRLAWARVWDVDNFVLSRVGGKFMESTEDLLRISLFARYYDPAKPETAKMAREMVFATHFNYSDLTPMETRIKSFIPFFVWTRRNLPRQMELAFENPRYVQRYRAMLQSMNDNLGGNDPTLPESDNFSAMAAGTDYYVNPNTPFWGRVMIDPDLPIRDIVDLPVPSLGNIVKYANDMLGPHISLLSDLNEQREFGDVNAPAPFNAIMKGLAAVGLYDDTLDGDVRIPYYMRTAIETALPFAKETVDPITGGSSDPNRAARMGITEADSPLEASLKNIAGIGLSGVGVKLTTPADVRSVAARSNSELDRVIQELKLQGEYPVEGG